jgi:hypothetical protein
LGIGGRELKYKSLISGAHGNVGFEVGDLIDVPDNKCDEWLAAGLIEAVPELKLVKPKPKAVDVFANDGFTSDDRAI